MKLNKILMTASLLFAGVCANAQETVTEYVFQPHWYGQLQFGIQWPSGTGKADKLISPNGQLAVGYKFNPYIGLRLGINAWQSKDGIRNVLTDKVEYYDWKFVAPAIDASIDLTNIIWGYNPKRVVEFDLLAGIGVNIGFDNKKAGDLNKVQATQLENYWDGTKCRFLGQVGAALNFNVSDRCQVGLEFMANTLSDGYNSQKGSNTDWYFNCLAGVQYAFGPKYETVTRVIEEPVVEPQIVERIIERVVEQPVVEQPKLEPMRRDVFFKINTYNITPTEMQKVAEIAQYLNEHPNATVTITGYADKGTGTMQINLRLSAQRAEAVAKALREQYGISASRMTVKSMGEAEFQPYPDPVQNRVAICIAE